MPENITHQDAQYALDIVKTICTRVGPGLPGSAQEWERAAMIQKELETHLGAGNVVTEEFTLAPGSFQGAPRICASFTLIAALLYLSIGRLGGVSPWLASAASLAFSTLSVTVMVFEILLYREFIDPFLKKSRSVNVVGALRRPGAENVKRLLILSGHHDSAQEFTWLRLLGYLKRLLNPGGTQDRAREDSLVRFMGIVFLVITLTMFLGNFAMLVLSIIRLGSVLAGNAGSGTIGILGWVLLAYPILPSIIIGMLYDKAGKGGGSVPGAADNLSASAVVVALCRFLVNNPSHIPADTEIRFISFGSEEAGLRGSRRYVARHLEELKRLDARLLNYELVAHAEISILTTDVSGVKNAPQMVKSVVAAAQRAGVPFTVKANPTGGGGSDAGSFSQVGLKAATLQAFKMPQQMLAFYHQKWDSPEILTLEPLFNMLKLTFEWVRSGGE